MSCTFFFIFLLYLSAPNPNNLIVIFPLPTLTESETIADRRRTLIIRVKSAPNIRRNICKDTKEHEPVKFDFFLTLKKNSYLIPVFYFSFLSFISTKNTLYSWKHFIRKQLIFKLLQKNRKKWHPPHLGLYLFIICYIPFITTDNFSSCIGNGQKTFINYSIFRFCSGSSKQRLLVPGT